MVGRLLLVCIYPFGFLNKIEIMFAPFMVHDGYIVPMSVRECLVYFIFAELQHTLKEPHLSISDSWFHLRPSFIHIYAYLACIRLPEDTACAWSVESAS